MAGIGTEDLNALLELLPERLREAGIELPVYPVVTIRSLDMSIWPAPFQLADESGAVLGEGLIEAISPDAFAVWLRETREPDPEEEGLPWQRCATFTVTRRTPLNLIMDKLKIAVLYLGLDLALPREDAIWPA
jgi:hypothetical protein